MDCSKTKEIMWDMADEATPPEIRREAERHISVCDSCRAEYAEVSRIKYAFRKQPATPQEQDKLKAAMFANIFAQTATGSGARQSAFNIPSRRARNRGRFGIRKFAASIGFAVAASIAIIVMLIPRPTAALNLDDIAGEHIMCVKMGHHKGYTCATQVDLAKKAMNKLGVAVPTIPEQTGKFVSGEICDMHGIRAAHAVIITEGKLISRFSMKKGAGFASREGVSQVRPGLWRYSTKGLDMVIMERKDGSLDICAGEVHFDKLIQCATDGQNAVAGS